MAARQAAGAVAGALLVALALVPAWYLKPGEPRKKASGFIRAARFCFGIWRHSRCGNLATGSFNPFANVYFAHLRFPASESAAFFRLASGATGRRADGSRYLPEGWPGDRHRVDDGRHGCRASRTIKPVNRHRGRAGVRVVHGFPMDERAGLNALLMSRVTERERSGASALNYLVAFSAQAVAALAAGRLLAHFGYGVVLAGSALLAAGAAGLFQAFVNSRAAEPRAAHSIVASTS